MKKCTDTTNRVELLLTLYEQKNVTGVVITFAVMANWSCFTVALLIDGLQLNLEPRINWQAAWADLNVIQRFASNF